MPHRYAPDDHLDERTLLVAAAYVLLLRPGSDTAAEEVLLLRRCGTNYRDGHWAVLAGHVEPGESVTEAALREAHEEAGVLIAAADLVPLTAMHRYHPGAGPVEQRIDMFFAARRWTGDPHIAEPDKADAIGWFTPQTLPVPTVPHERLVLESLATTHPLPPVIVWRTDQ
ncbi:MAG: NUDIX domain-containing protein [Micrococcales bacterium]|nr:NUDIX domain-containing protein [Micrococcales bacterium]MCL2666767.1 NUDIX domain-containing protein [Micrococcales bacterium]